MLEPLFGEIGTRVLFFLQRFDEGYAREIAGAFEVPLNAVQKQLQKFERGGILVSRMRGRTRLFTWNPRYPFARELRALLTRAMAFLSEDTLARYYARRTRPRRSGKPA